MAEILEFIRITIESIIQTMGLPGIALVMFMENVFTPIPSEIVMPFAGFLVERGEMSMVGILASSTIGVLAGAVLIYYIGVWADEPIIRAFIRKYGKWIFVSIDDLDRVMGFFGKYGQAVVLFGRLIPIVRSRISLPAGMNRMNMGRFLLFTTLGSLIWNTLLGTAGYVLGANWEQVLEITDRYEKVWLVLMALVVVGFVVRRIISIRAARAAEVAPAANETDAS